MKKILRQFIKLKWFILNHSSITNDTLIIQNKPNYNTDGLIIFNNCDCLEEEKFKQSYQKSLIVNDLRGLDGSKFDMRWRYYIVCYFANLVKNLDGDFVECGVYKGGYSMALMQFLNFEILNKSFWLFDTYEGLSFDHLTVREKASGLYKVYSHYEDCYDWVCYLFKDYPTKIIKGTVPETLYECKAEKICYLSIDMNCVEPEIAAANYFWEKIVPGGVIILDDYGFNLHIEQKIAFDKFALDKGVQILQLPTGQGVIFKL
jgi:hypothetical protein